MTLLVVLLGCGGEATPPPPAPPEPTVERQAPVVAAPGPTADGEAPPSGPAAVPVELQFVGVGGLHKGWFGDLDIVTELSRELGSCMTGRAVVQLSYDENERIGRIRLILDGKQVTCSPTLAANTVDLTTLEPLGRALAKYRDTVAGRFDFRVASFRIQLELLDGTHGCVLQLGGQFPPDGSSWGNCVDLGGEKTCAGPEDEGSARLRFEQPDKAAYLGRCFALRAR